VYVIVALKLAFGLAFSILTPAYRPPDESSHVDMIRYYREHVGLPDPVDRPRWSAEGRASDLIIGVLRSPRFPQRAENATPRGERPTFAELRAQEGVRQPNKTNHMAQHPPLYYATAAALGGVAAQLAPTNFWSWDREVYLYRLLSIALCFAIPLLASMGALAIGLTQRQAAVAAAFTLLLPMQTFIGMAANNDAVLIPLAAIASVGALAYLHLRNPGWAFAGAIGAAGATLTKSTAALLSPWVALLVGIGAWQRSRRNEPRTEKPVRTFAITIAILAAGAWWHTMNLIRFSDPQPSRRRLDEGLPTSFGEWLPVWASRLTGTFWGQPARRTGVSLAWPITHVLTALLIAAVILALAQKPWRRTVVLLQALIFVQFVLLFRSNLKAYHREGVVVAAQGRYLYALLVPLAVLVAIACIAIVRWLPRLSAIGIATGMTITGTVLHFVIAWSMLDGYWFGASVGTRLGSVLAWSPLPYGVSIIVLLLPFAVVVAWIVDAARRRGRGNGQPAVDAVSEPAEPALADPALR
jgi:hypothetical protein